MAVSVEAAASASPSLRWMKRGEDGTTERDVVLAALRNTGRSKETRDLRSIRLIGEDLSGLDLSGCDLSGADLSRSNLSGARLVQANLSGAILNDADLSGAELLGTNLSEADLTGSDVGHAGFGRADLSNAVLFGVHGEGATFAGATLVGADVRTAVLPRVRLREANLRGASFERAELVGADLESSQLEETCFDGAVLRESRLRGILGYAEASWIGTNIQNVDFCGAYLVRRHIMDQNFLHEFRLQNRAMYWLWSITSDCGRSIGRWGLWTALNVVIYAGLYSLSAVDYGDYPTPMSALYYSVITLTSLGYGDVLPQSMVAQGLAMSQVVLGYVMLGGLISILGNKMARRAD